MRKAIFFDFDDSFSFNVISLLCDYGYEVESRHWSTFSISDEADLLVLGPGPGHPNDYQLQTLIKEHFVMNPKQKWLGICLGHQLLGMSLGFTLFQLTTPIHGRNRVFNIPTWKVFNSQLHNQTIYVQFYNSWALKRDNGTQVLALHNNQILSFQFHPESVGTTIAHELFVTHFDSVYTEQDELSLSP